jgi:hypothetical protein
VPEVAQDEQRRAIGQLVVDRQAWNEQVDEGGGQIQAGDEDDRELWCDQPAVQSEVDQNALGQLRVDQRAADDGAEHDGGHRGALHPAVGDDQPFGRQQFGEDPVFGRRIHCRADADDGIGQQRVQAGQHDQAAGELDRVGDQHDPALGLRIGKRPDQWGQHDVGDDEDGLQQRRKPFRRAKEHEQADGREQQGVVGQRGQELCQQDDVERAVHVRIRAGGSDVRGEGRVLTDVE